MVSRVISSLDSTSSCSARLSGNSVTRARSSSVPSRHDAIAAPPEPGHPTP